MSILLFSSVFGVEMFKPQKICCWPPDLLIFPPDFMLPEPCQLVEVETYRAQATGTLAKAS